MIAKNVQHEQSRSTTRRKLSMSQRRMLWGYFFISPWIIGFLVFSLYPILAVFYYGFTDYSGLKPPTWIGWENYVEMFRYDKLIPKSLWNTAVYVFLRVPLHMLVGFFAALLLNRGVRGIKALRTALYLPTIVPGIASVIIWMWLLDYNFGILNYTLVNAGLPRVNWLGNETLAKPSIVLMGLWQIGAMMMIFLAGLQAIPRHLYEAAEIDGASGLRKLLSITIPMMSPVIFFNLILDVIQSFQVFTAAFIATGGGPLNATLFFVLYMYRESFQFLHLGYGTAMATVLFLLVAFFTLLVFQSERYWVSYDRT